MSQINGVIAQKPWLLAGDFNVLAYPYESSKYDGNQGPNADIKEFTECMQNIIVFDYAYIGPLYTWSNRQGEGYMARKLDRVLINQVWLHTFSDSKVEFLSPSESDHCAAFVQLSKASYSPPKPFKFFNFWVKHSEFMDTVKASWEIREVGSPMVILHKKMKRLKPVLRAFNASRYVGISDKVKEKRKELDALQISILSNSLNTGLIDREKVVTKELHELMKAEESFHRQKSSVQWLQERDFNTIFFL